MLKMKVIKNHGNGLHTLENGKMYAFKELNGNKKYIHTIDSDQQIKVHDYEIDKDWNVKYFILEEV